MSFLRNIYIRNLLLLILVIVVLLASVLIWLNHYTQHGKVVEIPDVKGLSIEKAEPFFISQNLGYQVVDSVFSKIAIPGTIAETTPAIGTKVKIGRVIYLKINAFTPQLITIPNVKDSSQRQALAILRSMGFERIEIKIIPGVHRDLVVGLESQGESLEAGQKVPAYIPLSLLVSSGSENMLFIEDSIGESGEVTPDESWF